MRFISRFWTFHKDFTLKEGTLRVPLPFSRNWLENHSHNLRKALGASHSLYPFHLSIPFTSLSLSTLSLSPLYPFHLYPFHLSIPFTSLSLSPLYPFHLSIPFTSLSLLYLPPSLYLSFYLSLSLLLSIILLGVSSGVFVLVLSSLKFD